MKYNAENYKKWEEYIDKVIPEYRVFMKADNFPQYHIEKKPLENVGEDVFARATTQYDDEGKIKSHILQVSFDVKVLDGKADYIVYHELTHILDAEECEKNQWDRVESLGFSGFHAAQVELLKLTGAKDKNSPCFFSMEDPVEIIQNFVDDTFSFQDYLLGSYMIAKEKLEKLKEMADKKMSIYSGIVINSLEPIFNYWGRRSVCQKYSKDYGSNYGFKKDPIFMQALEKFISYDDSIPIHEWNSLFNFNMDEAQIVEVNRLYGDAIDYFCL